MDFESRIGQLFFVGIPGRSVTPELTQFLGAVRPGGIVLFARNIEEAGQVRSFCASLSSAVDPPPFLSVDQEGGRVNRLLPLVGALPPPLAVSRSGEEASRRFGRHTGRALKALGFNMDFAPCVDLSSPEATNGIAERAFGREPGVVSRLAGTFLSGLQSAGIAGVIKHFPGLGPTDADTHLSLPTSTKSAPALWEEDLVPFRVLAGEAGAVMVAHAHYTAWDPATDTPASLSPAVATDLLRRRIGFDGVAIPDDLEMGAVRQRGTPGELALQSLLAGSDMPMFCSSREQITQAHATLCEAVRDGRLTEERVEVSLARILRLKKRLGLRPLPETLPREEFASAAAELARLRDECAA
jgi:beta-N-acetylhexosaminidase